MLTLTCCRQFAAFFPVYRRAPDVCACRRTAGTVGPYLKVVERDWPAWKRQYALGRAWTRCREIRFLTLIMLPAIRV